MGWDFFVEISPASQKYWNITDRSLSALSALAGLWLTNVVAVIALDKVFSKVLRSSPLAKKILPLLKYAASALIWGFGLVFVLSIFGVNVSTLLTGAGIGGLVFALASKEFASNLFGSLSLIFGNFFKIHDRIRVKGFEGTVEEITLSYTRLTDKNGHSVFMPNKYLNAEPVENLSQNQFKTADIPFSVPTSFEISRLSDALTSALSKIPNAKVRLSVVDIGTSETKLSAKIEAPSDNMEKAREMVTEHIFKVYLK